MVPFDPNQSGDKIFNWVRKDMGMEFQARIPKADQADLVATVRAMDKFPGAWNQFASAFINKVGLTIGRNQMWNNPLAIFKKGMLEFGDTVEEFQVGVLKAYRYDHDQDYGERALFARERPEIQTSYHTINREDMYKITIDEPTLKRAFLTSTGLSTLITQLMDAPVKSDNWDEYLMMKELLGEYERNGGFFKVHSPEIPLDTDGSLQARQALRQIRTYTGKLRFLSRRYNAAGMPVHAEEADLVLITTPEFQAAIDVEALAVLFNVSYAEISSRIVIVDEFPSHMKDIRAVLTTSDFFQVYDVFYDTRSTQNAAGLYENHFLHHWQIISCSRFVPAIAITVGEGTVIPEIETPVTGMADIEVHDVSGTPITSLERGSMYQVTGSAITTPEGGINDAVRFALEGKQSTHTIITNTAVVHVAIDEAATSFDIVATSTDDPTFNKRLTVNVVGDLVVVWPNPEIIPDDDKDGKLEVTPEVPTREGNNITIPTVTGVQYKKDGVNVNNGSVQVATASPGIVITAVSRDATKYEIAPGAPASWTYIAE